MVNNDRQCHPYIVEYFHKRRKLSSKEERHNYFSDEVLVEILSRLSHIKYVIRCQSVCKRWADLISDSYFLSRFIALRLPCLGKTSSSSMIQESSTKDIERSFAIVAYEVVDDSWMGLMMNLENPLSNIENFTLSPLPYFLGSSVVAACNDVLLYRRDQSDRYLYSLYNLQTRQWLFLPPTPFYYGNFAVNGFICDPYYSFEGGKATINETCRLIIVVAPFSERTKVVSKTKIHLFSSRSKQWTTQVLVLPRPCKFRPYRSFAFDGKLHFRLREGILSFDPYEGNCMRCHLIGWPPGFKFDTMCVGVCQGQLQVANFCKDYIFFVWVLKDYGKGEWSLVREIAPGQWIYDMLRVRLNEKEFVARMRPGTMLAQHPLNPDIIYMFGPPSRKMCSILMCNTSSRTVKVVCDVPESMKFDFFFSKYSLTLPVWPTPFPTLV